MSDLKQQALAVAVLAALGERITRAAEQARADGKEAIAKAWQAEELAELMSRLLAIEGGES
jgi:hypothetical protein